MIIMNYVKGGIISLFIIVLFPISLFASKTHDYIDSAKKAMFNPDSSAMYFLDDAYESARTDLDKAEAIKQKGIWNYYRSMHYNALSYYRNALNIIAQADEESVIQKANIYNNMALCYEDMGVIDSSLLYHEHSFDLRKEVKDTLGLLKLTYPNMIGLLIYQGDYARALELSYEMLSLSDQSGDFPRAANAYDFAGSIFEIQENFSDAKSAYEAALSLRQQVNDSLEISRSYANLAIIYYRNQAYQKALQYSKDALSIKMQYNDINGLISTYNNLGLIYQSMDSLPQSLDMYMKSFELGSQRPGAASLYAGINITAIALKLNDINMAYEYGQTAYDDAVRLNSVKLIKEAALNLALVQEKRNRFQDAFYYLEEAYGLQDSLFNEEITRKLTEKQLAFEYKKAAQQDSIQNAERIQNERINYEKRLGKQKLRLTILVFVLIFVVLLAFFVVYYYRNKQRIVNTALEKRAMEIETSLLRAQMNPHFIFNSMNSIQNFISRNDSIQAERYLSKFARLIRLILENSSKGFVVIEDELSLIENYLEIEALRLDGKLSFTVNVAEVIDTEAVFIPSMLIQPYVENAILHGIVPKDDKGEIRIDIKEGVDCSCLIVVIEDDGIGRIASQKRKQDAKHKSVGMRITKDRLALLSIHRQTKASVDISDVIVNGEIRGTKVEIVLPIKTNEI